jgi:hypothetical protein
MSSEKPPANGDHSIDFTPERASRDGHGKPQSISAMFPIAYGKRAFFPSLPPATFTSKGGASQKCSNSTYPINVSDTTADAGFVLPPVPTVPTLVKSKQPSPGIGRRVCVVSLCTQ